LDIKTLNILMEERLGEWRAVLTDFGVAQISRHGSNAVRAFQFSTERGLTICYAAPELFTKADVRQSDLLRTDIYSFAAVIFAAVAGVEPWMTR
jgi:serine/threonine protein kinase